MADNGEPFPISPIKDQNYGLTRTRSAHSGDFKLNRYLDCKHKEIQESVIVKPKGMQDILRTSRPRTATAALLSGARALASRKSMYSRTSEKTPAVKRRAYKNKTDFK